MLNKKEILTVFGLFVIFTLFQTSSAIKCWECRSDSDPKCGDPFDNSTFSITDCRQAPTLKHLTSYNGEVKATMCRKIRQKLNGEWRYFRSCAYIGEPGIEGDERFCLMRTGSYNIFMEFCTCNSKDGCNSSTRSMSNWYLVFIPITIGLSARILHLLD